MVLSGPSVDFQSGRKWSDYGIVNLGSDGSKYIRNYIERFNTVSFFNEYAGILSFFFVAGQVLAPYMRIPIHGAHIDCRVHVFWIQQSRTGKSIAYEFTAKLLEACGIPREDFTAGSDAKLIGTVDERPVYDDEGKPTGEKEYITIPGILNGYKTLTFDEGSVLLNDSKAYFSDKILYLQQSMAPLGSASNVMVKHLVGGTVRTPSGVSLWMTTFPPKDIMAHVLEKGFFQRVFLYQNDVGIEQRQTTSEHRLSGAYVPVPDNVWGYDELAEYLIEVRDEVRDRLLNITGLGIAEYEALSEGEREDLAVNNALLLFNVGPNYHAALLNACDDYYTLIRGVKNENVRETAMSFLPNVENYTMIFANIICAFNRTNVITAEHVQLASEIIYDNLHNLTIWLEQKQDYRETKKRDSEIEAWKKAHAKVQRHLHKQSGREVVKKPDIEKAYAKQEAVALRTAQRRMDKMVEGQVFKRFTEGRNAYVALEV